MNQAEGEEDEHEARGRDKEQHSIAVHVLARRHPLVRRNIYLAETRCLLAPF